MNELGTSQDIAAVLVHLARALYGESVYKMHGDKLYSERHGANIPVSMAYEELYDALVEMRLKRLQDEERQHEQAASVKRPEPLGTATNGGHGHD